MSIVIKWELKKEADEYVLVQSYESVAKNALTSLQKLVGGRIEVVTYLDGGALLMNEEALINGSAVWAVPKGHFLDRFIPEHFVVQGRKVIAGSVLLVKDNGENFLGFESQQEVKEHLIL
ncbi:DUF3846 domain-containing protein [Vibrio parahaemolyticus]|nr:DUF3846 domain-containing protein [Vibrio parahaemolyticus]